MNNGKALLQLYGQIITNLHSSDVVLRRRAAMAAPLLSFTFIKKDRATSIKYGPGANDKNQQRAARLRDTSIVQVWQGQNITNETIQRHVETEKLG